MRPNIGLYTQPISFIGLPVICVPLCRPGQMPLGVQLVSAPWCEDKLFAVAARLEQSGIVQAAMPRGFAFDADA